MYIYIYYILYIYKHFFYFSKLRPCQTTGTFASCIHPASIVFQVDSNLNIALFYALIFTCHRRESTSIYLYQVMPCFFRIHSSIFYLSLVQSPSNREGKVSKDQVLRDIEKTMRCRGPTTAKKMERKGAWADMQSESI